MSGGLFAAIADGDVLFLGVLRRGLLDDGPQQGAVCTHPVADQHPLLTIPLLQPDRAAALVVRKVEAGEGQRLPELLPDLLELTLSPYVGRDEAIRLARGES